MFAPGGQINWFAVRLQDAIHDAVRSEAPKRTGELAGSFVSEPVRVGRGYSCTLSIASPLPHARFVAGGTTGPITGHGGPMVLYAGARVPPPRWAHTRGALKRKVAGQRANRFLDRALVRGMARHGLV